MPETFAKKRVLIFLAELPRAPKARACGASIAIELVNP